MSQLHRFCLYGFLKNQRYFEAFFLLALLDKGLSFTEIGLLFGGRELLLNLLEIPSGALADSFGKRRCLLLSLGSYVLAYACLGWADGFWLLASGFAALGVGDSFRSGTHKAMIFTWLRLEGREQEKTSVYGRTRSWSKTGSALSVLVGGACLWLTGSYAWLFWLAIPPCLLGIGNILRYPDELDPRAPDQPAAPWQKLSRGLGQALRQRPIRKLLLESMAFEGLFKASKDYLQPFLQISVLGLAAGSSDPETALWLTPIYAAIFALSAVASRQASRFQGEASPARASRRLWTLLCICFTCMALGTVQVLWPLAVLAFLALHCLQNLFRPILIGRIQEHIDPARAATVLSVESQTRGLGAVLLLPALGALVDATRGEAAMTLLPVGLLGLSLSGLIAINLSRRGA